MRLLIMLFILALNCHAMAFPVFHIAGQEEISKKVIIPIMNYTDSIKKIEKKYLSKDYYNINLSSGETTKLTPEKLYVTCKWSRESTVTETHTLEDIVVDGKVQEKGIDSFCETRVHFKEIYNKNVHNIIVEQNIKIDFLKSINKYLMDYATSKRESIKSFYEKDSQAKLVHGDNIYLFSHLSHIENKKEITDESSKKLLLSFQNFSIFRSKYLNIISTTNGFNAKLIINDKYFLSTNPSTQADSIKVYSYFKINDKEYAAFKLDLNYNKEFKNQYRIINITDMKLEESYDLVYGSNFAYHGF